jgi:3-oxoadipate enol-lactonase
MPYLEVDDVRLHYRTDGDPALPCLVLSNSLGTDLSMWDEQAAALAGSFHVLRYDTRGHGRSGRGTCPASLERLGRDVAGLLDGLAIRRAHFCGISMGGLTGQWLGMHLPERIGALVLANTAARIGQADAWTARAVEVRRFGMDQVADGAAARWFTPGFAELAPGTVARMTALLRTQDPEGYAACCDALAVADLRAGVASIGAPTLVIVGERDPVTTVDDGLVLRASIAGARLVALPVSHLSSVEAGNGFTAALAAFLAGPAPCAALAG